MESCAGATRLPKAFHANLEKEHESLNVWHNYEQKENIHSDNKTFTHLSHVAEENARPARFENHSWSAVRWPAFLAFLIAEDLTASQVKLILLNPLIYLSFACT